MSSTIEVLKKDVASYESLKADNKIIKTLNNEEVCMMHYPQVKEAIVALEKQESDKGWVCDVCDRETASCLSLCPDCNDRKQGALEELWLIGKELTSFIGGDKSTNIERNRINNYIEKRIKELEKEGVEQK